MSAWQPMETIPKDRRVLVKHKEYSFVAYGEPFKERPHPVISECWHKDGVLELWLGDERMSSTDKPYDPIAWCEVPE